MDGGILFLEDDDAQMLIYKGLVSRFFPDVSASFAARVPEAEEILKHHPIRLAVVDLMIPVTNGADLIMKMKTDSLYKDIKIIVVTAAAKGTLLYTALGGIVEEFVTKPIQVKEFVTLLERYINEENDH